MSSFNERVREVVEPMFHQHLELHQDGPLASSTHSLDDLYNLMRSVLNITQEVKSEVYHVEHDAPAESEDSPDQNQSILNKIKDWFSEGDRIADEYGYSNIPQQAIDDMYQRLRDLIPLVYKMNDAARFVFNNVLRSVMLDMKLRPLKDAINELVGDSAKRYRDIVARSEASKESVLSAVAQNDQHVRDFQQAFVDCCTAMKDTMRDVLDKVEQTLGIVTGIDDTTADIQSKVNALQPEASANNTLEILQKQKMILSELDEIRGLL